MNEARANQLIKKKKTPKGGANDVAQTESFSFIDAGQLTALVDDNFEMFDDPTPQNDNGAGDDAAKVDKAEEIALPDFSFIDAAQLESLVDDIDVDPEDMVDGDSSLSDGSSGLSKSSPKRVYKVVKVSRTNRSESDPRLFNPVARAQISHNIHSKAAEGNLSVHQILSMRRQEVKRVASSAIDHTKSQDCKQPVPEDLKNKSMGELKKKERSKKKRKDSKQRNKKKGKKKKKKKQSK